MSDLSSEEYTKPEFPVVAIGASAGGMEAFSELLQNLPGDTGLAYIYLQHLSPTHESNLVTILTRYTNMPVLEAEHDMKIKTDHLYVIPANKEIKLVDGIIALSPRPEHPYSHLPINRFFISLAEHYKESAIGIILSGTAADGTLGLKAIKMEGGLTFVQDSSARFDSMPKSAIAEGAVDLVLSPKQMAEELKRLGQQKDIYFSLLHDSHRQLISDEDEDLAGILNILFRTVGVDFSQYKMNTIKRRIVRRMMLFKIPSIKEYLAHVKKNANEIKLLYQDLLINVTTFFRDPDTCDYLRKQLIPKLIKSKAANDPIRVWVPACSTGQEAYSLAILTVEALEAEGTNRPVQIFATDLSEHAINKARIGTYDKDELVEVSQKRLQRFFTKIDGTYRVIKSIRDLCIFAEHNILKDPPFSRLDMVSCCNLMIYLDKQLQRKVLATFHYSLQNEGYLVLGKSETIGNSAYIFTQFEKKLKIYIRKKDTSSRAIFDMNLRHGEIDKHGNENKPKRLPKITSEEMDLEKAVDELLLKRFSPASVIVTPDLDIVQFRGSAGIYLEPAPGKASLNLVKMAKTGLGFDIRNIVHKAKKTNEPFKKSGLEVIHLGKSIRLSIEAVPIAAVKDEYYLVVFEEMPAAMEHSKDSSSKAKRVQQLEAELATVREDMRSIVESHEAANEELQSANEEVVSSNEELQSINEELETSKEEIESSNEELMTINQELQMRNDQLAEAQDYAQAIFATIGESVVILDRDLRVKFANNAFYRTFKVNEEDTEGELLYELGSKQWNIPVLREMLITLLNENIQVKGYEVVHDFPGIGRKIMRLNASKLAQKTQNSPLIILAFEDITEFKNAHENEEQSINVEMLKSITDKLPALIWVTGPDKLSTYVNGAWREFTGLSADHSIGASWLQVVHPDDIENCLSVFNSSFKEQLPFDIRCRLRSANNKYVNMLVKGKPYIDDRGNFKGFIGACVKMRD